MIIAVSSEAAKRHSAPRHASGAIPAYRTEYIGVRPDAKEAVRGSPQAFSIDMAPGQAFAPHFHVVPQFQVVMQGCGFIGKKRLQAYAVHFADDYTAYGPLVADLQGMRYMTLRADADPGPKYIADLASRAMLRPSRRRFRLHSGIGMLEPGELQGLQVPRVDQLIAEEDDGMLAAAVRLPPGAPWTAPHPACGGGQFGMVMSGKVQHAGRNLDQDATFFVGAAEDAPLVLQAQAQGAQVLFMQVPRLTTEVTRPRSG